MSNQGEGTDIMFIFMMLIAPFCIFALGVHFSSIYLERTVWKPFWKQYTEKVEGRMCRRVTVVPNHEDGGSSTREIKHAIIDFNVNGITMQRTFHVVSKEGYNFDGKPSIGSVSLETFDAVNSLTLRRIPCIPESAFPELEWELQQRPYPWYFYVFNLFVIALASYWPSALVPLMEEDKWKKRAFVVTVALYVTLWPVAYIVARRFAFAQMKRQETTKDFTNPQTDSTDDAILVALGRFRDSVE